jgi:hypothetical protein
MAWIEKKQRTDGGGSARSPGGLAALAAALKSKLLNLRAPG